MTIKKQLLAKGQKELIAKLEKMTKGQRREKNKNYKGNIETANESKKGF